MRPVQSRSRAALAIALTVAASAPLTVRPAHAQSPPAVPAPAPAQPVPLTEEQVQGFLAAQKELAAIGDQEPEASARIKEAAILKKNGFPDAAAYGRVVEAITAVMAGIDEETGKYVGADALIRQQLDEVKADKKIAPKERAETIQELEQILANPSPALPPGDVAIVLGHYKEIQAAMPQDPEDE